VGDVEDAARLAHAQVLDLGQNALQLAGPVKAENPAAYVANPCAAGTHEGVWTLNAALPGQPASPIPVYVDHTTGPDAAFGSAKLQICFRDPSLPPGDPRRSPNGTKFLNAAFTLEKGIFGNPVAPGQKLWRSIFTPYRPGTGNANPAAPHLHFAVMVLGPEKHWWQATAINPYPLLIAPEGKLAGD
jgi:hypothetical protein